MPPLLEFGQFGCNIILEYTIVSTEQLKLDIIISAPIQRSNNYFSGFQVSNILVAHNENKYFEIDINFCTLHGKIYICKPLVMVHEKLNLSQISRTRLFNIHINKYFVKEIQSGIFMYIVNDVITGEILCNYDFISYIMLKKSGIIGLDKNCVIQIGNKAIINSKTSYPRNLQTKDFEKLLSFNDKTETTDYGEIFFFEGLFIPSFHKLSYKINDAKMNEVISSNDKYKTFIIVISCLMLQLLVAVLIIYVILFI